MLLNQKTEKFFWKIKISFSFNLTLLSFLILVIIFFVSKYSLLISLALTFFWIIFLIIKSNRYRIGLLLFLFLLGIISFYGQKFWFSWAIPQTIVNKQFTIVSISNNYVILKYHHWKILWWTNDHSLVINQQIKIISSQIKAIKSAENSYNFDFSNFLTTKYVFYQLEKPIWINGNKPIAPRFYFFQWLTQSKLHKLVKTFTWQQPLLPELKEKINDLDWGYLLVLNSFAFSLVGRVWIRFRSRFHFLYKNQIFNLIYGLTWFSYCYLLSFNLIVLRFLIHFLLKSLNLRLNPKQQRLFILMILSWWEPTYFLRLTSWFLIVPYLIWPIKNFDTWYKKFFFSCALMIPLQIMLNYRFNLAAPILLTILGPLFSILHVLLFLLWWCPGLYFFWNFSFEILKHLILLIQAISWFWNIGHVPIILYILYFLTFSYLISVNKSWKCSILIIIESLIILFWNKIILANENIFMLNVGNGNSFVYINKFKNLVLIFDCGAGPGSSSNNMADFLKWHGINHVDYLFISHFHQDHYNGLEAVKNTVKVRQIITNETDIFQWNFKGLSIIGWQLKDMKDVNDSSLILLFKTNHANLLFMGDLTKIGEQKLIETTNFSQVIKQNKIDWMQLGHHGSKNSTSFDLLHLVNPAYVFISSGTKNNHSFPDLETIDQLQKLGIKIVTTSHLNWSFNLISQKIHSFH